MDTSTQIEHGRQAGDVDRITKVSGAALESLIPIAVVIAAGCEPCATKMVERALRQDTPVPLVVKTLQIVATLRSADCFAAAVGPEVVARMGRPLRAGRAALKRLDRPTDASGCSC